MKRCEDALVFSVSYTTRKMRPGEKDGVDYYFVDEETFQRMVEHLQTMRAAQKKIVPGRSSGSRAVFP